MTEESILIEKSAAETESLVKRIISQIYGKIIDEETRRIYWEYEIGIHTIECESFIQPQPDHTIITTTAFSKTRKSSSKQVLNKFHESLLEDLKNTDATAIKFRPAPDKQRIEPQKSGGNSFLKSITAKHVIIVSIAFIVAISLLTDSEDSSGVYSTNEGYYGAYTKEDFNRLMRYGVNNDEQSLNEMYMNGRIIVIPTNRKAYLVEQDFGAVKIKLEGNTTEFWTVMEAITN